LSKVVAPVVGGSELPRAFIPPTPCSDVLAIGGELEHPLTPAGNNDPTITRDPSPNDARSPSRYRTRHERCRRRNRPRSPPAGVLERWWRWRTKYPRGKRHRRFGVPLSRAVRTLGARYSRGHRCAAGSRISGPFRVARDAGTRPPAALVGLHRHIAISRDSLSPATRILTGNRSRSVRMGP
jgi:hypothetical protein